MKLTVLLLLLLAALTAGCKKDVASQTSSAEVSAPPRTQTPQSSQAQQFSKRFMGSELGEIFDMTQGNVEQRYGVPSAQHTETVEEQEILVLVYENALFHIDLFNHKVCFAALTDPEHPPLRGVVVGTAMDAVLSAFQDEGSTALTPHGERFIRLLYGEYGQGNSYGVVWYDGEIPDSIEYGDGDVGTVIFELTDEKVSRMIFKRPVRY
ncbi:MAG: hypothetical protein IJC25_00540 [Clostridia bacterium]|nr:hypothetical protein [Clostridia bacterium]